MENENNSIQEKKWMMGNEKRDKVQCSDVRPNLIRQRGKCVRFSELPLIHPCPVHLGQLQRNREVRA